MGLKILKRSTEKKEKCITWVKIEKVFVSMVITMKTIILLFVGLILTTHSNINKTANQNWLTVTVPRKY
ncbi:hypothetical protein IMAU80007_02048 [Lactiplantibacillus plantarum]|nr:hypothetical protein [Lactiplantibacillus plantarum]MCG0941475.1 hypothetical protein [Lactiplantibacillus plantarum]